ncbi:MAG: two-component regulator propeller domain-containing protein [Saprospiraceae bacterium]
MKHWFFLLGLILWCSPVIGQRDYYRKSIFRHLSVDDGLAHRTVNAIAQDGEGLIWVGTNNGLNRYDGQEMEVYHRDIQDPHSLPGNIVLALLHSHHGRLWIITGNNRLCWYDPERNGFIVPQLKDQLTQVAIRVQDMAEDTSGRLWILSTDNRIYCISGLETSNTPLQLQSFSSSLAQDTLINRIVIDHRDGLWMETREAGIFLFKTGSGALDLIRHFPNSEHLRIIDREDKGQLWFAGPQEEIFRASLDSDIPSILPFYDLKDIIPDAIINSIKTDDKGAVWIALYGAGLVELIPGKPSFSYTHYPGYGESRGELANNRLLSLLLDRYNVLWIGTEAGLFSNHLHQKPFYQIGKQYQIGEALVNNIVHAIYRDRYLWIGTRSGLTVIDTMEQRFYNYLEAGTGTGIEGNITCLYKDHSGFMWIGAFNGLLRVRPDNAAKLQLQPVPFQNSSFPRLQHENFVSICEDEQGRIWLGTFNQGIYIVPVGTDGTPDYRKIRKLDTPGNFVLTNMYKDPFDNTIWVGTRNRGLMRITSSPPDEFHVDWFRHQAGNSGSLSFDHTNPIIKTDPQTLWVGTIGGGFNKLDFSGDSVQVSQYTTHQGLPDNTIHSIRADREGRLWLGSTVGLTRFDPRQETFTHYDWRDGLQGNLFIVNSSFRDRQGRLYFGGANGLNFFQPEDIFSESSVPDILIRDLKIINNSILPGEKVNGRIVLSHPIYQLDSIVLKEKENDLTFDIRAIHTAAPEKNRLSYRLTGHQEEWIDANGGQATINYSNLRPGSYTLEIRAANGDGIENPQIRSMFIRVRPYWYKTRFAYLSYGLLLLLALWQFRQFIIMQSNLRNNLKIARIEREKDLEMANMKTRFFNNMTHELRTPLTLIQGPVEELIYREDMDADVRKNHHYLIHRNAQKLLQLVNRLLDFRKSESVHFKLSASEGDLISFAREVFLAFRHLAHEQQIDYVFVSNEKEIRLYFDPEKMEILLGNLLSNAFKYSNTGDKVALRIRSTKTDCILEVADTGRGMKPEEVQRIFDRYFQIVRTESSRIIGTGIGLSMVKTIVGLHQGSIEVETEIDQGSTFIVRLPLGRAHLSDDQILEEDQPRDRIEYHTTPPSVDTNDTTIAIAGEAGQLKLLVVEDNPEIRTFICTIFSGTYQVQEAANGLEGLLRLEKEIPDLIISDIMMDQMDGITFCSQVKEHPDYFHIPVILLTARTSNVYQVDGLTSGADAYITKPFNAQVLQAQADSLLKSRAALKAYYTNRITLGPKAIEVDSEELLFLEQLISLIEAHLNEEQLTAEFLSTQMAMSHSTLYRKIKSYTGESINSFIRSIRLKQAAQLLTDSGMNISEVAYRVGFSDVDYFRKCFKKQFGTTPTDFIGNKK